MQRPDIVEDHAKVARWAQATYHNYQPTGISHFETIELARVECYSKLPYGKRFAIHHLKYPADDFPQRKFEAEEERMYDRYVNSCKVRDEFRMERHGIPSARARPKCAGVTHGLKAVSVLACLCPLRHVK